VVKCIQERVVLAVRSEDEIEKILKDREKKKFWKDQCSDLRHDRRTKGVKFYDAKGTGRIVKGKKIYRDS